MSNAVVDITYKEAGPTEKRNTTVGWLDPGMTNTNTTEYKIDGFATTETEVKTALAGRFFSNVYYISEPTKIFIYQMILDFVAFLMF